MRRSCFVVIVFLMTAAGYAQPAKFSVKGDVSKLGVPVDKVLLIYNTNSQSFTDSSTVKNGSYSFSGNVEEATLARLIVRYKQESGAPAKMVNPRRDYAFIFLEPGNTTVTSADSFSNITVSGSKANEEYKILKEQAKPFEEKIDALAEQYNTARKNKDEALIKKLEEQLDAMDAQANEKIYATYVKQHPNSPIAMYALNNWAGYDIDPAKVEPLFNALPEATRNSPSGKVMQEKIEIAKKTSIGQVAMDFTQNDTLGNPVSLSSLRGKYLLVDFWASWCGPCRAENPNVVKVYDKYHNKGFGILGVSLDRPGAKDKWIKAIHDDHLDWSHVSDLQYWNNAVARLYGIQAIPQNLLLDPSGKIIAKNLRGETLEKKLSEIFHD